MQGGCKGSGCWVVGPTHGLYLVLKLGIGPQGHTHVFQSSSWLLQLADMKVSGWNGFPTISDGFRPRLRVAEWQEPTCQLGVVAHDCNASSS